MWQEIERIYYQTAVQGKCTLELHIALLNCTMHYGRQKCTVTRQGPKLLWSSIQFFSPQLDGIFLNIYCLINLDLRHPIFSCITFDLRIILKLMFSKKVAKIDKIFTVDLTVTTYCLIDSEDFLNFRGLLRKREL